MSELLPWQVYESLGPIGTLVGILILAIGIIVIRASSGIGVGLQKGLERRALRATAGSARPKPSLSKQAPSTLKTADQREDRRPLSSDRPKRKHGPRGST